MSKPPGQEQAPGPTSENTEVGGTKMRPKITFINPSEFFDIDQKPSENPSSTSNADLYNKLLGRQVNAAQQQDAESVLPSENTDKKPRKRRQREKNGRQKHKKRPVDPKFPWLESDDEVDCALPLDDESDDDAFLQRLVEEKEREEAEEERRKQEAARLRQLKAAQRRARYTGRIGRPRGSSIISRVYIPPVDDRQSSRPSETSDDERMSSVNTCEDDPLDQDDAERLLSTQRLELDEIPPPSAENEDSEMGSSIALQSSDEHTDFSAGKMDPLTLRHCAPCLSLPPSSTDLLCPTEYLLDVLSIYECLRRYSRLLRLSPFRLEDFLSALAANENSALLAEVHISLLKALVQEDEANGTQLCAPDCKDVLSLTFAFLLDRYTWPHILAAYLLSIKKGEPAALASVERLASLSASAATAAGGNPYGGPSCGGGADVVLTAALFEDDLIPLDPEYPFVGIRQRVGILRGLVGLFLATGPVRGDMLHEGFTAHDDFCRVCRQSGEVLCCDSCPAVFHLICLTPPLEAVPSSSWNCPICRAELAAYGESAIPKSGGHHRTLPIGTDRAGRVYWHVANRIVVEPVDFKQKEPHLPGLLEGIREDWETAEAATESGDSEDRCDPLVAYANEPKAYYYSSPADINALRQCLSAQWEPLLCLRLDQLIPTVTGKTPDQLAAEFAKVEPKSEETTVTPAHMPQGNSTSGPTQAVTKSESLAPTTPPVAWPPPPVLPPPVDREALEAWLLSASFSELPPMERTFIFEVANGILIHNQDGIFSEFSHSPEDYKNRFKETTPSLVFPPHLVAPSTYESISAAYPHWRGYTNLHTTGLFVPNKAAAESEAPECRVNIILNRLQQHDERERRRLLSNKFCLSDASLGAWAWLEPANMAAMLDQARARTKQCAAIAVGPNRYLHVLRLTLCYMEAQLPAASLSPAWRLWRQDWQRAVLAADSVAQLADLMSRLEAAVRCVAFQRTWSGSLGPLYLERFTAVQREEDKRVRLLERSTGASAGGNNHVVRTKTPRPIRHTVWKTRGEEYRRLGGDGWIWLSVTRRRAADIAAAARKVRMPLTAAGQAARGPLHGIGWGVCPEYIQNETPIPLEEDIPATTAGLHPITGVPLAENRTRVRYLIPTETLKRICTGTKTSRNGDLAAPTEPERLEKHVACEPPKPEPMEVQQEAASSEPPSSPKTELPPTEADLTSSKAKQEESKVEEDVQLLDEKKPKMEKEHKDDDPLVLDVSWGLRERIHFPPAVSTQSCAGGGQRRLRLDDLLILRRQVAVEAEKVSSEAEAGLRELRSQRDTLKGQLADLQARVQALADQVQDARAEHARAVKAKQTAQAQLGGQSALYINPMSSTHFDPPFGGDSRYQSMNRGRANARRPRGRRPGRPPGRLPKLRDPESESKSSTDTDGGAGAHDDGPSSPAAGSTENSQGLRRSARHAGRQQAEGAPVSGVQRVILPRLPQVDGADDDSAEAEAEEAEVSEAKQGAAQKPAQPCSVILTKVPVTNLAGGAKLPPGLIVSAPLTPGGPTKAGQPLLKLQKIGKPLTPVAVTQPNLNGISASQASATTPAASVNAAPGSQQPVRLVRVLRAPAGSPSGTQLIQTVDTKQPSIVVSRPPSVVLPTSADSTVRNPIVQLSSSGGVIVTQSSTIPRSYRLLTPSDSTFTVTTSTPATTSSLNIVRVAMSTQEVNKGGQPLQPGAAQKITLSTAPTFTSSASVRPQTYPPPRFQSMSATPPGLVAIAPARPSATSTGTQLIRPLVNCAPRPIIAAGGTTPTRRIVRVAPQPTTIDPSLEQAVATTAVNLYNLDIQLVGLRSQLKELERQLAEVNNQIAEKELLTHGAASTSPAEPFSLTLAMSRLRGSKGMLNLLRPEYKTLVNSTVQKARKDAAYGRFLLLPKQLPHLNSYAWPPAPLSLLGLADYIRQSEEANERKEQSRESLFRLHRSNLRSVILAAGRREVPGYDAEKKRLVQITWAYPSSRPTLAEVWRFHLRQLTLPPADDAVSGPPGLALSKLALSLRLLWHCLRWDDLILDAEAADDSQLDVFDRYCFREGGGTNPSDPTYTLRRVVAIQPVDKFWLRANFLVKINGGFRRVASSSSRLSAISGGSEAAVGMTPRSSRRGGRPKKDPDYDPAVDEGWRVGIPGLTRSARRQAARNRRNYRILSDDEGDDDAGGTDAEDDLEALDSDSADGHHGAVEREEWVGEEGLRLWEIRNFFDLLVPVNADYPPPVPSQTLSLLSPLAAPILGGDVEKEDTEGKGSWVQPARLPSPEPPRPATPSVPVPPPLPITPLPVTPLPLETATLPKPRFVSLPPIGGAAPVSSTAAVVTLGLQPPPTSHPTLLASQLLQPTLVVSAPIAPASSSSTTPAPTVIPPVMSAVTKTTSQPMFRPLIVTSSNVRPVAPLSSTTTPVGKPAISFTSEELGQRAAATTPRGRRRGPPLSPTTEAARARARSLAASHAARVSALVRRLRNERMTLETRVNSLADSLEHRRRLTAKLLALQVEDEILKIKAQKEAAAATATAAAARRPPGRPSSKPTGDEAWEPDGHSLRPAPSTTVLRTPTAAAGTPTGAASPAPGSLRGTMPRKRGRPSLRSRDEDVIMPQLPPPATMLDLEEALRKESAKGSITPRSARGRRPGRPRGSHLNRDSKQPPLSPSSGVERGGGGRGRRGTCSLRGRSSVSTRGRIPIRPPSYLLDKENDSPDSDADDGKLYCVCKTPYDPKQEYIGCDLCQDWFHFKCVGLKPGSAADLGDSWHCPDCKRDENTASQEVYCLCRTPYDATRVYIACDNCDEWYHAECVGMKPEAAANHEGAYICPPCISKQSQDQTDRAESVNSAKRSPSSAGSHAAEDDAASSGGGGRRTLRTIYETELDDQLSGAISQLLADLKSHKLSWPFMKRPPASVLENKRLQLKEPLDLPRLIADFKAGVFRSLGDFSFAGNQLFSNARLLHPKDSNEFYCTDVLEAFFLHRMREIRGLVKH
ncbi:hypothetical protein AAHC03_022843 [Spirometra sp. Aus1]